MLNLHEMIERRLESKVRRGLDRTASVALLGPRQVGKTTLAHALAEGRPSVYIDLEDRLDLQKVQDIAVFYQENREKLIILDEVQRMPEIFAQLRDIIDAERRAGHRTGLFLFLGSASGELLQQSGESLAGRISYLELFPIDAGGYMTDKEDLSDLNKLWLRGGFPESLASTSDEDSLEWRNDFIKTYLERDIPQLGPRIPATTLQRFWTMLAHTQGTNLNASKLAANMDVSSVTIARYVDLLVDLMLVRKILPYTANVKKRLIKAPRVYVRDSGIVHALLNIGRYNDLLGHPVVGKSWEGFVIENIMAVLPRGANTFYYRTATGEEIDLVIELNPQEKWAVEIKLGQSLALKKGFHTACADIDPQRKFVVYSGADTFTLPHDVTAIPLYGLMQELLSRS